MYCSTVTRGGVIDTVVLYVEAPLDLFSEKDGLKMLCLNLAAAVAPWEIWVDRWTVKL